MLAGAASPGLRHVVSERPPDIGRPLVVSREIIFKPPWHHADDGECLPAQRHRLANDVRISVETTLPEGMADHDDEASCRTVFFRFEITTKHRTYAQDPKIIA